LGLKEKKRAYRIEILAEFPPEILKIYEERKYMKE